MTVCINGKRRNVLRIVCENSTYVRNCFPGNPKICLRNVNHANMIHTKRIRTYVSTNTYVRTYVHRRRTTVWHCLYKGSCTLFLFHLTPVMSLKSLRSQMYAPHQRSAYVQTFVLLLLRTLYVRTYLRTYVRMRFYITIRKHFNHIVSPPTSSMRFFVSAFALSVAFVLLVLHDILLVLRIPP